CRRIKESGLRFLWGCDMRADSCSENELRAMYDAGCRWIFFGIESGSPRMQRLIDKNLDLDKARRTLETCARLGIVTTTSFIVGFPGETREDLMQTVAYALSLPSDVKMTFSFGPIPGSALYEQLVAGGRLEPPRSCRAFGKLKWFDTFGINYSDVPTRDFKVITSWFILAIIRKKHFTGSASRRTWYRRMFSMAAVMLKRANFASVKLIFSALYESAAIVFYANMFPSVRKKYGLAKR
ncbi:MAG TPA: radical SAM protein, partial [Clostridiales bacterium]|nr:radical SAM protein [Clostridiales bacterium]